MSPFIRVDVLCYGSERRRRSTDALREASLRLHHRRRLVLYDRRGGPFAGQGLALRGIEAGGQMEGPLRGGQPVGLLASTRTVVLEVQVERTIRVVLKWHPAADGEAVGTVGHREACG